MMLRVESALFQGLVVGIRSRGEGEKAPQQLLRFGLAALGQKGLGMIGVLDVLMALIAPGMTGDELILVVETQPLGVELEGERSAGVT
jgi:hypothetical protein